jgi:hypothetical protein
MTLGASPQPADVVAELGLSLPYTFQKSDPKPWWLADLTTASNIVFPTSFANKQSIKQVDVTALSALGTSHSFAGVNFGTDFTGRVIFVVVAALTKASADTSGWSLSGGTIGGQADAGPGGMVWFQGGSGSTVFTGSASMRAQPSGTSGTISFNTATQTRCICTVLSIANCHLTSTDSGSAGVSSTGGSTSLNVPTNGILISGAVKNNTNTIGYSGITLRGQQSPLAGYQIAWGWDNRLSLQSGLAVSFSSTGSAACAFGVSSHTQP